MQIYIFIVIFFNNILFFTKIENVIDLSCRYR